jgi:hypothetical protein
MGYVPYHYYKKRIKTCGSVKEQAKRELCPASGKSIEDATKLFQTLAFKAAKLLRENRARQTNKPKTIKAFKITPKDGFLPEP